MHHKLNVEAFSIVDSDANDGRGGTVSFELDPDLYVGCGRALGNVPGRRIANQAALVLVELAIDGEQSHRVRVDRTGNYPDPDQDPALFDGAFNYPHGSEAQILTDAIAALTVLRDQLVTFQTVEERSAAEHHLLSLGDDGYRPAERTVEAGDLRVSVSGGRVNILGPTGRDVDVEPQDVQPLVDALEWARDQVSL